MPALEEFLISGCAIQRVTYERRRGGLARWVDIVSPARFFINSVTDLRGDDVEILGTDSRHVAQRGCNAFSMGDRRRADALRAAISRNWRLPATAAPPLPEHRSTTLYLFSTRLKECAA